MRTFLFCLLLLPLLGMTAFTQDTKEKESNHVPDANELNQMSARFAPTPIRVDTSKLSAGDKQALAKLVQAARILNPLFMTQMWSENMSTWEKLKTDPS